MTKRNRAGSLDGKFISLNYKNGCIVDKQHKLDLLRCERTVLYSEIRELVPIVFNEKATRLLQEASKGTKYEKRMTHAMFKEGRTVNDHDVVVLLDAFTIHLTAPCKSESLLCSVYMNGVKFSIWKDKVRCTCSVDGKDAKKGKTVVNKMKPFLIWLANLNIVTGESIHAFYSNEWSKMHDNFNYIQSVTY